MKKRLITALVLICMMMLAGCGQTGMSTDTAAPQKEDTIQDVASTETQADTKESDSTQEALTADGQGTEEKAEPVQEQE